MKWNDEDIEENLSLRAKLKGDFGIEMPRFPEEERFSIPDYCEAVAKAISRAKQWDVIPNAITLGFFSFAKFLMYRDLDPENWPEEEALTRQPFITGLLQDGFPASEALPSDDIHVDEIIPVSKLDHVVDADSSQTLAIEGVRHQASVSKKKPAGVRSKSGSPRFPKAAASGSNSPRHKCIPSMGRQVNPLLSVPYSKTGLSRTSGFTILLLS